MKKYKITRLFLDGNLKGLTHTEITSVKFEIGFIPSKPYFGSPYKIISVEEI